MIQLPKVVGGTYENNTIRLEFTDGGCSDYPEPIFLIIKESELIIEWVNSGPSGPAAYPTTESFKRIGPFGLGRHVFGNKDPNTLFIPISI